MGRESEKESIYIYLQLSHLAVQQKLTRHCKATMCVLDHSVVSPFGTPWTVAHSTAGSSVHGISQARILESGLPFPSSGNLLSLGTEPVSLESSALAGGFFTTTPSEKKLYPIKINLKKCVWLV